jgi:hypothetical protein
MSRTTPHRLFATTATATATAVAVTLFLWTSRAAAHCDTLDGPVVQDARAALRTGDVTPVLKWVPRNDEPEIRQAFARTMKVRALGDDARDLADLHFFETLVRLHRAAEGVPYTGLKPAGSVDPGIAAADHALAQGSPDDLARDLTRAVESGLRARFEKVAAARAHADDNVDAGRAFVAAYVEFIHYVEALHALAAAPPQEHHHIHSPAR